MSAPKTKVSLRLTGDTLVPEEVTRAFGCVPTNAFRRGDEIAVGSAHRNAPTGVWRLEVPELEGATLDEQVCWVLDQVSDDVAVWTSLSEQYNAELFVGVFLASVNQGLRLSPATAMRASKRGLSITLDLYYGGNSGGA
jgi:hypothetical protein